VSLPAYWVANRRKNEDNRSKKKSDSTARSTGSKLFREREREREGERKRWSETMTNDNDETILHKRERQRGRERQPRWKMTIDGCGKGKRIKRNNPVNHASRKIVFVHRYEKILYIFLNIYSVFRDIPFPRWREQRFIVNNFFFFHAVMRKLIIILLFMNAHT